MKTRTILAIALAIAATSLTACGGGDASASSSPQASPTISAQQRTDRANRALTVTFVSAVVTQPSTGNAPVQVRVLYRLTANDSSGVQSAYGNADLPWNPACDGGSTIPIEYVGSLPYHASVERTAIFYCDMSSTFTADFLGSHEQPLTFTPTSITLGDGTTVHT